MEKYNMVDLISEDELINDYGLAERLDKNDLLRGATTILLNDDLIWGDLI